VNALGVRHVADAARRVDAPVYHVSTDYVFDGTKTTPYVEWDTPNPQSVYGASKLGGERELDPGSTIVRTSWICGFHGGNMVKTILRLAGEHPSLSFVDDQRGHPTFADDLAAALKQLVIDRRPGTFHVTNQGAVSWYEFAREVLLAAGDDPDRVSPIATADLHPPRPAPRPTNSVLDNAAWRLSGLPLLPDFRESLQRLVSRLLAQ
jgi:dTDP-4-dehydrorhamnose reductase